jgi:hypothetical protein
MAYRRPGIYRRPGLRRPSFTLAKADPQSVSPGLIDQTGSVFAPAVTQAAPAVIPVSRQRVGWSDTRFQTNRRLPIRKRFVSRTQVSKLQVVPVPPAAQQVEPALITQTGAVFAPQVNQAVLPGLITQTGATFAPSVTQSVSPALINQTGATFSPQVNQQVLLGLIDQTGVVFSPTITQGAAAPAQVARQRVGWTDARFQTNRLRPLPRRFVHRTAVTQIEIPPVAAGQVSPSLINQTGAVFSPQVNQQVLPGLITQSGAVFAPQVNQSVAPALINQTGATFAPVITQRVTPGLISQTGAVFSPQVNQSVAPALINQTGVTFAPSITQQVLPGLISQVGTTFAPQVNQAVTPGIIDSTGATFAPSVTQVTAAIPFARQRIGWADARFQSNRQAPRKFHHHRTHLFDVEIPAVAAGVVSPSLITQTGQVFGPSITQQVTPALIASTGATFAPSVTQVTAVISVGRPRVGWTDVRFQTNRARPPRRRGRLSVLIAAEVESLPQEITPALIDRTGQVFSPSITQKVLPGLINNTGTVFAPVISIPAPTISPSLIVSTGTVFAPSVRLKVTVGLINQTGVLFTPVITQKVTPGFINQTSVVFAPVITQGIAVPVIDLRGRYDPVLTAEALYDPQLGVKARHGLSIQMRGRTQEHVFGNGWGNLGWGDPWGSATGGIIKRGRHEPTIRKKALSGV